MVTAFSMPDGLDGQMVYATLRDRHGVVLAGGQGRLRGKIMRIGHMGYMNEFDIITALAGLELALTELGYTPPARRALGCGRGARGLRRCADADAAVLVKEPIAEAGVELLERASTWTWAWRWPPRSCSSGSATTTR